MKSLQMKKFSLMAAVAAIFTFFATQAMAITAPVAGSFGYEAYNFLVTTLLKGPFGAISAILLFLVTILLFVQQKIVPAIVCLVVGDRLYSRSPVRSIRKAAPAETTFTLIRIAPSATARIR